VRLRLEQVIVYARRVGLVDALCLSPWVVATPDLEARLAEHALGFRRSELAWYDPTRVASADHLDLLDRVDELTFGPRGLRMPRWAFYDCAELPGALFGFSAVPSALPEAVATLVPAGSASMPVSLCMATPMVTPGHWLVFSICSLFDLEPGPDATELAVETLALTLGFLAPRRVVGTMQWGAPSLPAHARFGPLRVRAGWVPAHTHAATCVFELEIDDARIRRALDGGPVPPAGAVRVDPADERSLAALQRRLEAGESLSVVGSASGPAGPEALVVWGQR
jgi:hypothetical protein